VTTRLLYHEVEGRVTPTVRFVGSMNPDLPGFIASPDALERRLIFLPCGKTVASPDPERSARIGAEKPGILARWVRALQRLYARGGFDIPPSSDVEVADYVRNQDAFDLYVAERLTYDHTAKTSVAEITKDFNVWAEALGVPPVQVNVVGRKLRRVGFQGGFARAHTVEGQQNLRIVHAKIGKRFH
jgi:hypothetical protein